MGYNLAFGYFNCYSCGSKRAEDVLQLAGNISYKATKELLAGVELALVKDVRPTGRLVIPDHVGPLKLPHWNYLEHRGLDAVKIAKLWDVQGIGIARYLQWRLFIPVIFRGQTVSWTTRSICDDARNRYISAKPDQEKVPHKDILYGEDFCRNAIVIVEGPVDAWKIGPGACCTFGMDYSKKQILRMVKYPVRVIVFDNSNEAQRRAHRLADQLKVFQGETVVVRMDAKDPGEAEEKDVRLLRRCYLD